MPMEVKKAVARMRWFCKNNLFYLSYHILGFKDLNVELHGDVCNYLDDNINNNILLLMPRSHFKSTLLTVSQTIQQILRNQNIRVMISNAVLGLLQVFSLNIRLQFENNKYLKGLFPEICYNNPKKESVKWTEDEFYVKRTKDVREPTVTIISVGSMNVGYHFDIGVYDDIVNYDNTATPVQIDKLNVWHSYTMSLLDPPMRLRKYAGTRYHFDDKYDDLIKESKENNNIKVYIRKAIENNKVIFPERFSLDILNHLRETQGSYIFNCQYMNDPIDSSNAIFRESDIRFIENWIVNSLPYMHKYIMIDPNFDEKSDRNNCDNAVCAVGLDKDINKFMLDYKLPRTIDELINEIFRMYDRFQPIGQCIYIEKCPVFTYLFKAIKDKQNILNKKFAVLPLEIKNRDKFSRILRLQPDMQTNKIWIYKRMTEIVDQFNKFPKTRERDIIDCFSYIYDIGIPPKQGEGQKNIKMINRNRFDFNIFNKNSFMRA